MGAVISAISGGVLTILNVTPGAETGSFAPLLTLAGLSGLLIALLAGIRMVVTPGSAEPLQFAIVLMWLPMMLRVIK